jgi:hypothetical protein
MAEYVRQKKERKKERKKQQPNNAWGFTAKKVGPLTVRTYVRNFASYKTIFFPSPLKLFVHRKNVEQKKTESFFYLSLSLFNIAKKSLFKHSLSVSI